MASFAQQIFLLFLTISLPSYLQVQARPSFFFSKFSHLASSPYVAPHIETPVSAPNPSPMPSDIESRNPNYGLYGLEAGSDDLPVTTTTFTNRNDLFGEKLVGESGRLPNFENDRYNNNGYFNNNNNRYEADERQGMSDTRFMEGGKYYYDPDSERNTVRNNYNHEGYYQGTQNFNEFNSMKRFENQQDKFYDEDQEEILP